MIGKLKRYVARIRQSGLDRKTLASISEEDRNIIQSVISEGLTYLSVDKLKSIIDTIRNIKSAGLSGNYIECGCALGGSTIVISKHKASSDRLMVYDMFGMIPPPGKNDTADVHDRYDIIKDGRSTGIGGNPYYGYETDLYEKVKGNLRRFDVSPEDSNVSLIKGNLIDTMSVDSKVVFAHIDVDWYDPVMHSLIQIHPQLIIGGTIILDDYYAWGSCKKATDQFISEFPNQYELDGSSGALKITKVS